MGRRAVAVVSYFLLGVAYLTVLVYSMRPTTCDNGEWTNSFLQFQFFCRLSLDEFAWTTGQPGFVGSDLDNHRRNTSLDRERLLTVLPVECPAHGVYTSLMVLESERSPVSSDFPICSYFVTAIYGNDNLEF